MSISKYRRTRETKISRAERIWAIALVCAFLELAGIPAGFSMGATSSTTEPSNTGIDPTALWEGNESELAEPFTGVIGNDKEWTDLWGKAFGKKPPTVEFDRYAVACVFLGHYPGWWYHIDLSEPRVSGTVIFVPYQLIDLIVELTADENGLTRKHGRRGQYIMKVVEKKPGFAMRMEMVGKPQVRLKSDFEALLKKDMSGESNEK